MFLSRVSLTLLLIILSLPATASQLIATRLNADNIHLLPAGGIDAIGGVGDWLLSNGKLCAVISAAEHQAYLSLHGGALVDLWHCHRANDQWVVMHDQHNMRKEKIASITAITARKNKETAFIRVVSQLDGIRTETEYQLSEHNPNSLRINQTMMREREGSALNMLGSFILHPRAALIPFTLDLERGEYSVGFQQPYVDTTKISEILAAVSAANLQVLLGSNQREQGISYGIKINKAVLVDNSSLERPLQSFLISSETFSLLGLFSEPYFAFSRKPSLLTFLRSQFMDVGVGEKIKIEREIWVGHRSDVSSITDNIYQGRWVDGVLDTSNAGIVITATNGTPVSFVRPDGQGKFRLRLPDNTQSYRLNINTPWATRKVVIDASTDTIGTINSGGFATVNLPIGKPMSIIFKRLDSDDDPIFMQELTGLQVGGQRFLTGAESNRLNLAGIEQDVKTVLLAPGRYQVIASRGIEYAIEQRWLDLKVGDVVDLDFAELKPVVSTAGLVAADLHVHSGVSMDSSLSPEQRVIDFIAQGGEVLVASEHNITYNIQPIIEKLGLQRQLLAITGVELSGMARSDAAATTIGHSNVFPVIEHSDAFMGGTLAFEGKRLGDVIADYKQHYPNTFFQLNHPRANVYDSDLAFFNHLSIDRAFLPNKKLTDQANQSLLEVLPNKAGYRDIDFDALELLNGELLSEYAVVREDWFSLLRQGYFKVATANSDSHSSQQLVALPRNYISLSSDIVAELNVVDIITALKQGRSFGTTGPIINVSLEGVESGGYFEGDQGVLRVKVDAAPWVNVDELRIFINGENTHVFTVERGEEVNIHLDFKQDSFVTVEVSGIASPLYQLVAPGFTPFAFSNPIFVKIND